MCRKSPSLAYFDKKRRTTKKSEFYDWLDDSPLRAKDYAFISDVVEGLSNKELADKFHKSESRIARWKREVCDKLQEYDIATLKH